MEQEEETKTTFLLCSCLHSDNQYFLIAIIHVAGRGFSKIIRWWEWGEGWGKVE